LFIKSRSDWPRLLCPFRLFALRSFRSTPDNNSLKIDRVPVESGRDSTARVLFVLRTEAAGGSRDLASIVGILVETF
jgi:hypothetical protein